MTRCPRKAPEQDGLDPGGDGYHDVEEITIIVGSHEMRWPLCLVDVPHL